MAEGLFNAASEQSSLGWKAMSAGIFASSGDAASRGSIEAMSVRGIDISGHRSRPLSEHLVREADMIVAVTRDHLAFINSAFPEARAKTYLLGSFVQGGASSGDVADPFGGGFSVYSNTCSWISAAIPGIIDFVSGRG